MSRSVALFLAATGLVAAVTASGASETPSIAITGSALPGMEKPDAVIRELMTKYGCPGGQLAVTHHGRLVLAHGYGLADRDTRRPVEPASLFRIASLSKLLTAVAILRLSEEGRLSLDAKAFSLLPHLKPLSGADADPRLAAITIRHLLQHTGGWDRDISGDPMFKPIEIATATHTSAPASADAVIRYMLGRPLDADPGSKYAYSNFGYCVLGRIIEQISGQTYETFVQTHILARSGVTHLQLGHSLLADRALGEVTYHVDQNAPVVPSIFPSLKAKVRMPDGGFHLEAMDAHGAWLASAVDYVRFLAALDGTRPPALLSRASLDLLTARPEPPVSAGAAAYYGFGIQVRPVNGKIGVGANWWHSGSLTGTVTYQVRLASGWSWAAFFNYRPKDNRTFTSELDRAMNAALTASGSPTGTDLFASVAAVIK